MTDAVVTTSGWERAALAAEKVKERLLRSTAALARAGVPYAVAGGNAVAEWVGRVDEDAVRNTRDVDILIRRTDLEAAKAALEPAGFVYCRSFDVEMFLDGPDGRPTSAVHVLYAGEKVRTNDLAATPDLAESEAAEGFQVVSLHALVRMKLTSYRDKDRTHLRDLIGVGLIDHAWPARLPAELAARLKQLLDNPNG
ncbi:MAG: nucleotidyltransferase family protein [Planctomycetaceae bacterium]|nr:nucleotidyltransferase family protein [Planctomycetaceae bacterium]